MPYRVDQPSTTIPVFLVVVEYANYGCTDMEGRLWRPGDKCPEGDYEHIPPRFYALPGILSGRPIRDLVEASMKGELEHVHDPRPRSQWSRCRYTGKITECECPTCVDDSRLGKGYFRRTTILKFSGWSIRSMWAWASARFV
jgi:hypothetical protein